MSEKGDALLIYGTEAGEDLVFIPQEKATELAEIYEAVASSETWGDFRSRLPRVRSIEVDALFDDEARPPDSTLFQAEQIPGFEDGDWPEWAAQEMLSWVPSEIQRWFGVEEASMVSGSALSFKASEEDAVVAAFEEAGFTCTRGDELVARATGRA